MPETAAASFLRPAFLTAGLAAVVSIVLSALVTLLARGTDGGYGIGFVRVVGRVWVVSVGSGVRAGQVEVGVVPVGAMALGVLVVAVVAAWVASEPIEDLTAYVASTAGAFGVVAALLSAATNAGGVHTSVVRAAFGAFVVGGLGAAVGAAGRHHALEELWFTSQSDVRAIVRAAGRGVVVVLVASMAIVLLLMVLHLDRAGDLWAVLDPGVGGGLALGLGCVLALPTLALWTASVLLGPGFVLGTDTSVDLTGSQLGAVPGLPVLASLPAPGEFPTWVFALGLLPLLAGIVSGWCLEPGERQGLVTRVGLGAAAGAVAGLALGVLVGLSGGAVGPGRLADAGPPLFTGLLVAVPVLALGGAMGAALAHYRGGRATQPTDASTGSRPRLRWGHQSPGPDRRDD